MAFCSSLAPRLDRRLYASTCAQIVAGGTCVQGRAGHTCKAVEVTPAGRTSSCERTSLHILLGPTTVAAKARVCVAR